MHLARMNRLRFKRPLKVIPAGILIFIWLFFGCSKADELRGIATKVINGRPVIINIVNAEVGTKYSGSVLMNVIDTFIKKDIDVTVSIIPNPGGISLQKGNELVMKLRSAYDRNSGALEIALNGYEFLENEFTRSSYEQLRKASEAQSILTTAFNPKKRPLLESIIIASTLSIPYNSYNLDTIKSVRAAGVKVIISRAKHNLNLLRLSQQDIERGYRLNLNGVTEIFSDEIGDIVGSYRPLEIKLTKQVIADIKGEIEKDPDSDDPIVITIPLPALWHRLGQKNTEDYLTNFADGLKELQQQTDLNFLLPREFYTNHHQGPLKYLILRVDDERIAIKNDSHHRRIVDEISKLGIPLTDSVIPIGYGPPFHKPLSEDSESIQYLENRLNNGRFEIALHGLYHKNNEFLNLSLSENLDLLKRGLDEFKFLKDYNITTFIPPNNTFSENTLRAMYELGMKILSTDDHEEMLFGVDKYGIMHISNIVALEKNWTFPPDYLSEEEMSKQMEALDDVVLMVHPFTITDDEKERITFDIIKTCRDDPEIEIVNLEEYYEAVMPPLETLDLIRSGRIRKNRVSLRQYDTNQDSESATNSILLEDARIAWSFFQSTVDPTNGLNRANAQLSDGKIYSYSYLTMWDVGSLILAQISANQIGILPNEEFSKKIERVLTFLETSELYNGKLPNKSYHIGSRKIISEEGFGFDSMDLGRLLIAMKTLSIHYVEFNEQCNRIIKRWDLDFVIKNGELHGIHQEDLVKEHRFNYAQYAIRGYQLWNIDVNNAFKMSELKNMDNLMTYLGELKRRGGVSSEPFVLEAIELGHTDFSRELSDLVFSAQQQRYEKEGIVTCVSEGGTDREPWFVFQKYLIENPSQSWLVSAKDGKDYPDLRFVSSKGAFAWYVLESNFYANFLYNFIRDRAISPGFGWYSGMYEKGNEVNGVADLNTNAIILEAIWYKLRGDIPLQKLAVRQIDIGS